MPLPPLTAMGLPVPDLVPVAVIGNNLSSSTSTDSINVKAWGATGNGTTDDTAAFELADDAAAALGWALYIPPGTYVIDGWTPTALYIYSPGATLKRKAGSTITNTVAYTNRNGFKFIGLIIDGNRVNQTNGGNNLALTGCWDFEVRGIESKNAKAASGNGNGIVIVGTADEANGTRSLVTENRAHHNDGLGIAEIGATTGLRIVGNVVHHNGSRGISVTNTTFPPSPGTIKRCRIKDNEVYENGSSGIYVPGFITGGTSVAPIYGHGSDPAEDIQITGNYAWGNTGYGIVAQFTRGHVTENDCNFNGGTAAFYAGILANCNGVTVAQNTCYRNEYYGIDAGGSTGSDILANECEENGYPSASGSGWGINLGASTYTLCQGNTCKNNGNTSGIQIGCPRVDGVGGGGIAFPWDAAQIRIINNTVIGSVANHAGIKVTQDVLDVEVRGNRAYGFSANNAMIIESTQQITKNNWSDSAATAYNMSANATLVIPDYVDDIIVNASSNVTVTSMRTFTVNAYNQAVMAIKMTARGSGYTVAPTVTFTGGGGSGAAATALITNDGLLANIRVDTPGTGYTSAPVIGFTGGGGGSGAAATATVAPWSCHDGRELSMLLAITGGFTVTFSNGTRMRIGGGTYGAIDRGHLTFKGWAGALYERSRVVM